MTNPRQALAQMLSDATERYSDHHWAAAAALGNAAFCGRCSGADPELTECECAWDDDDSRAAFRTEAAIHAQLALAAAGMAQAMAALLAVNPA